MSIITGMPLSAAACDAMIIDFMRASVILPRFTARAPAIAVIPATSSGCSAIIGLAPVRSTVLAQSLIDIGLVIQ